MMFKCNLGENLPKISKNIFCKCLYFEQFKVEFSVILQTQSLVLCCDQNYVPEVVEYKIKTQKQV